MSRYAAFLRGINLGDRRVKMAVLRGHLEELGLEGVGSYIASGNVVFDHPDAPGMDLAALEEEIEMHLEESLGFAADTFVRSMEELEGLVGLEVLGTARDEGFTPYVIFLKGEPDPAVEEALHALETPDDRFRVLDREVLWLRRGRLTDSQIGTRDFEGAFGGATSTRRKVRTVERMVEKFGAG